jgi:hypothetical protein
MNWRDYEKAIFDVLSSRFPTEHLEIDVSIPGRFSLTGRQIDVAGRASFMGRKILALVDCKCYSSRVDVKDVETVIGMAADVRADIAIIVTTQGFTQAARNRAENEPNFQVHLDIVTIGEAEALSTAPVVAQMYRGRIGVVTIAPSGWQATSNVGSDGRRIYPPDGTCIFHPIGTEVPDAPKALSIGWCNIVDNPSGEPGQLDTIVREQRRKTFFFDHLSLEKTWSEEFGSSNTECLYRRIRYKGAGYVDFTCFVDLGGNGVFWACVLGKPTEEAATLNRLRFIIENTMFVYAPHADPENSHDVWQSFFPWRPVSSDT